MSVDGVLLATQMQDALDQAKECVDQMVPLGNNLAEAERLYRQEKHKRIAYERAVKNTPVTIIQDVVKGYEDIAELACKPRVNIFYSCKGCLHADGDDICNTCTRAWGDKYEVAQ